MGLFSSISKAASGAVKTVGSFIPGVGDAYAQEKANEQNISLDKINREWMERMSNSAYQRAMDDMKKAGLNPMLAYQQGGASVPSSTAASVSPVTRTGLADKALSAFSGISAARVAAQNAQTAQAQADSSIKLQEMQTAKTVAETQQVQAETALKKRELRGKGVKETLDREGGKIIQSIMDKFQNSAVDGMKRKVDSYNKTKGDVKKHYPKANEILSQPVPKIF